MSHKAISVCLILALVWLTTPSTVTAQEYLWGQSNAYPSSNPDFTGYWVYVLSIGWDVSGIGDPGHGMSHVSLVLTLDDCSRACEDGYFTFSDTAGTGTGEGQCNVYFYAEFDCKGDPTVPDAVPTVKFEPYPSDCEPGVAGTASLRFYSLAPPDTAGSDTAYVWIKYGQFIKRGAVVGELPVCVEIPLRTKMSTWGGIKTLFE